MTIENFRFDPVLNILSKHADGLNGFFSPQNIALIGATEKKGSVGNTVLLNLLKDFSKERIFCVNPNRKTILDQKAYPSVVDISDLIDLAVIVTPASTVVNIVKECVRKKIKAAIIISAGFKELGEEGQKLELKILEEAKKGDLRIIGPNCLGVMNPHTNLNATFASNMALKGNIAFISQSGALCTAVLDWSLKEKVGFSSFVSIGSMVDVDWGELIGHFGNDPHTHSILIYMESIGNPRSFMSYAREVSLSKPIILIKAGVSKESALAAASHTGALAGSDDVFNAALKRIGVLRVDSIDDLFSMAEILSKQPNPKGPCLSIITNAGGPGVIATDALIKYQGQLTQLSQKTYDSLNQFLPKEWSHSNPVDILGDASPDKYSKTVEAVAKDPNSDGVLVILTPQYMTDPTKSAKMIADLSIPKNKPILSSWMGAKTVEEGNSLLTERGIPTFSFPEQACKTFANMWAYSYNLESLYETPVLYSIDDVFVKKVKEKVKEIFSNVRKDKRLILTEIEAKAILEAYGLPVVSTYLAAKEEQAVELAKKIGFPVVLKIYSKNITHKTDVGGVELNLSSENEVKEAFNRIKNKVAEKDFDGVAVQEMIKLKDGYEVIIGSSIDPQFGPTILFGSGGQFVEVLQDKSVALPPLTSVLAKRLMERTKIFQILKGARNKPSVNVQELEKILVRFSYLIAEYPEIAEFDINPLFASKDKIVALDARIVLAEENKPLAKLAIRPYPIEYIKKDVIKGGDDVIYRPIRPEDEPLIKTFMMDLSEKTILKKFLEAFCYDDLLRCNRLIYFCFNDYDREITIVAEITNSNKKKEILGMGRLTKLPGQKKATFALIVKDKYQRQGIGKSLLKQLIAIAKNEKVEELLAHTLPENNKMQELCKKLEFSVKHNVEKTFVLLEKKLF